METLLLPGMDGTGRLFAAVQRHLPPEFGARAIAYPHDQPRSYEQLLAEIPIPATPFAIVAESFSGPLGVRLATRFGDRVRALVLVATFVRRAPALGWWGRPLLNMLSRIRPPDFALRAGLLGMDASATDVAELRAAMSSVAPPVLAGRLREVASVDVSTEFSAGRVPVLYIAGARDRLIGSAVSAQMKRLRPDMAITVLDAPHLVLQRKPLDASRLIAEFVAAHRRRSD